MRRYLLIVARWALIGAVPLIALAIGGSAWLYTQARQTNVGQLSFANELAIPPLLEGHTDASGRRVFDLTLQTGETELLPGLRTDTWGVNGAHLGPTLRATRGDEVLIRVRNDLPEVTTVHWHGMHLPALMDGGPHQTIPSGGTWHPTWRINQPAATLWYHPHPHHHTAEHVYRGVAGLFLLDDEHSGDLPLPSTYGVDDVPLIVQDKRLNGDGSLSRVEGPANLVGILGDHILVNGTHDPFFQATTTRLRLRVLNGSNARVYNLGFDDGRAFSLIATDSGLIDAPQPIKALPLSPGERAEIIVDLKPGEQPTLRSTNPDLGMNVLLERTNGGDDSFDILQIHTADRLKESPPLPSALAPLDAPPEQQAVATRSFELTGFSQINGKDMNTARVDEIIQRDTVEIWQVHNNSNTFHNFHVHDIRFVLLDVDGEEPAPHLRGWKDTVFLPPRGSARFIAAFEDYADDEHPYMFHCHILAHEDAGMMGQFIVTDAERT